MNSQEYTIPKIFSPIECQCEIINSDDNSSATQLLQIDASWTVGETIIVNGLTAIVTSYTENTQQQALAKLRINTQE